MASATTVRAVEEVLIVVIVLGILFIGACAIIAWDQSIEHDRPPAATWKCSRERPCVPATDLDAVIANQYSLIQELELIR